MALTQISTKGIKDGTITGTDLATNIDLSDSQKLRLGTGNDLVISQDGSEALIRNTTGDFFIQNSAGDIALAAENHITLKNFDGQTYARFMEDGQCELYHDDSKKLNTNANGVHITDTLTFANTGDSVTLADNQKVSCGNGGDLKIFHSGSHSFIKDTGTGSLVLNTNSFRVNNADDSDNMITADELGAVKLFFADSNKLETTNTGVSVTGQISSTGSIFIDDGTNARLTFAPNSATNARILATTTGFAAFTNLEIRSSTVAFKNAGNTQILTLDSSGRVGINTSSPQAKLHTASGSDSVVGARITGGASGGTDIADFRTNNGTIRMQVNSNLTVNTGSILVGTTDVSGRIHARTNVGSSSNFADNNAAIPAGDQYIHISNSNTGGNEQAGFVMNASGSASAIGAIYVHKTNSYLGSMVFRMRTNATTSASRMEIDSQGNIGAPNGTNIHNASDARVKKNVTDLDKGLSAIKSLRPVSFNWIDGFCDKEKNTLYGFIAQEVETVDSNLIQQFGDGSVTVEGQTINDTLRVNEKFLIPMLVKAMQELSVKIETLETKVASLEAS